MRKIVLTVGVVLAICFAGNVHAQSLSTYAESNAECQVNELAGWRVLEYSCTSYVAFWNTLAWHLQRHPTWQIASINREASNGYYYVVLNAR